MTVFVWYCPTNMRAFCLIQGAEVKNFKMWFFFKMCFHFQNVKGFVGISFPFTKKHNCKKNLHIHYKLLYWWGCKETIYIKLLNLFQLSRIHNLLYLILQHCDSQGWKMFLNNILKFRPLCQRRHSILASSSGHHRQKLRMKPDSFDNILKTTKKHFVKVTNS